MVHLGMPNSSKQQLTISNNMQNINSNHGISKSATNLLNISMPPPRSSNSSNASFTVQSTGMPGADLAADTGDTPIVENEKKTTSIFNFKNKNKKSKSPKKGKK